MHSIDKKHLIKSAIATLLAISGILLIEPSFSQESGKVYGETGRSDKSVKQYESANFKRLVRQDSSATTTTTTISPPRTTITRASRSSKPIYKTPVRTTIPITAQQPIQAGPTDESGRDIWQKLADCETGGRTKQWPNGAPYTARNDVNDPYWGYFQFTQSTWRGLGESGLPSDRDYNYQKQVAIRNQARSGWGQWPDCKRRLGL